MSVLKLRDDHDEEPPAGSDDEIVLPETPPGLDAIRAWVRKPRPWLHGVWLWIAWILSGPPEAWRRLQPARVDHQRRPGPLPRHAPAKPRVSAPPPACGCRLRGTQTSRTAEPSPPGIPDAAGDRGAHQVTNPGTARDAAARLGHPAAQPLRSAFPDARVRPERRPQPTARSTRGDPGPAPARYRPQGVSSGRLPPMLTCLTPCQKRRGVVYLGPPGRSGEAFPPCWRLRWRGRSRPPRSASSPSTRWRSAPTRSSPARWSASPAR